MNFKTLLLAVLSSSVVTLAFSPNLYAASDDRAERCAKYYGFSDNGARIWSCVYGMPNTHPAPGFEHVCDENWLDYCPIQESIAPTPQ